MGKKLNVQLIQMRCKTDRLEEIDKINLWGNDLEEVSIIRQMHSVKVVSLALNKLQTLEDFAYCPNLTDLLLRKNEISDLREVNYLSNCPNLEVLWLAENPIAAIPNYRMYVLKVLPNLRKLDEVEVTPEEVEVAASMSFDDDDLGVPDSKPQRFDAPPTQPASEDFEQNDGYNFESPKKPPSYEMNEPNIAAPHQPVQRSPPMPNYEDNKQPSYSPMNEVPQAQHQPQNPGSKPVYWSKGPTGGEMYGEGGKFPSYEIPQRPQTGNPYSRETPPLRYGMNDTGNYFPPMQQPRLMHAHSTPLNAGPAKPGPNGGKYKNENILCAVLVLLKELEENELELVKRDIDKKLNLKKLM